MTMNWNPKVTEGETGYLAERLAGAVWGTLQSPNESDSNGEPANVVDGLYAIAKAIHHLARATEGVRTSADHDAYHAAPFRAPDLVDVGKRPTPARTTCPRPMTTLPCRCRSRRHHPTGGTHRTDQIPYYTWPAMNTRGRVSP